MADRDNPEEGGPLRGTTIRRTNKGGGAGDTNKKRGQKVQNNQTLADFWNSNPNVLLQIESGAGRGNCIFGMRCILHDRRKGNEMFYKR